MLRRDIFKLTGVSFAGAALSSLPLSAMGNELAKEDLSMKLKPTGAMPLQLNFNENSIGMAPKAREAVVQSLDLAFRYPDDQRAALIDELADKFGVSTDYISLGNGSSENIQAIVQALIQKAKDSGQDVQLVVPDPTFDYAELYATAQGVKVVKVPLTAGMDIDVPAMKQAAADFSGISVFYLCNPNNPTATIIAGNILNDWVNNAPENQFFLIDEAYAEFVTDPAFASAVDLVKQGRQNVAVTRTFSKLYALAGLRIGYALAVPELIKQFESFMSIDNTNLTGAVAALASLHDTDFAKRSVESVNQSRIIVTKALDELGLAYAPSHANFIFHEIKGDVPTYQQRMKDQHVWVGREFPPVVGWSRLTLGTPEEMNTFVSILKGFREKGWT